MTETIIQQQSELWKDPDIQQRLARISKLSADCKIEIIALAEKIEDKYISTGQQWLVNTISEDITRILRDNDISVWYLVTDYLPQRFKQQRNGEQVQSSSSPAEVLEQLSILRKSIDLVPRDFVSELENESKQLSQLLKRRAELEHIALFSNADKDSESADQEQVNMDKSRPRGSIIQDAFVEASNVFKDISDRVYEFPDEVLRREQEIADGVYTFLSLFDSALDLKYSQDWLNWFQAEKYRDIFGKHAAGVLSFSVTNLCRNCSDEEHNQWIRMEPVETEVYDTYNCLQCHAQIKTQCINCNLPMRLQDKAMVGWQCTECGGTNPIQRDLTREQIGDKSSIVVEAAEQVIERIPVLMSFFAWYRDSIKPLVAGRKTRLSNKLSAKA